MSNGPRSRRGASADPSAARGAASLARLLLGAALGVALAAGALQRSVPDDGLALARDTVLAAVAAVRILPEAGRRLVPEICKVSAANVLGAG